MTVQMHFVENGGLLVNTNLEELLSGELVADNITMGPESGEEGLLIFSGCMCQKLHVPSAPLYGVSLSIAQNIVIYRNPHNMDLKVLPIFREDALHLKYTF